MTRAERAEALWEGYLRMARMKAIDRKTLRLIPSEDGSCAIFGRGWAVAQRLSDGGYLDWRGEVLGGYAWALTDKGRQFQSDQAALSSAQPNPTREGE